MRQFQCDYVAGCHPAVLQALVDTNALEEPGYGEDSLTQKAVALIRKAARAPKAEVFLFTGGTQVNLTVVGSVLRAGEGVIATTMGHVQAHETGAIEATGHRVITVPSHDGKMVAADLEQCLTDYHTNEERMLLVKPGMVYISQPTELGTVYTDTEIASLSEVCRRASIPLYVDGARLAYALAAQKKVSLAFLAQHADLFYIGGTKCGALAAEALVIPNTKLATDFVSQQRLRGALLAKGRLLGAQFAALFTDRLYEKIGAKAVKQAQQAKAALKKAGVAMYVDSPSNQLFILVTEEQAQKLSAAIRFEPCGKHTDGRRIIRICTAWSTTDAAFADLMAAIATLQPAAKKAERRPAAVKKAAVKKPAGKKASVKKAAVKKPTARKALRAKKSS